MDKYQYPSDFASQYELMQKQKDCRHSNLKFLVGGTAIECRSCRMLYIAGGPFGSPQNYYNINILSTDERIDPLQPVTNEELRKPARPRKKS